MTSNTSDISVMSSDLSSHCQQIVVNQINDKIYESDSEPMTDLELLLKAENLLLKYELRQSVTQIERQKTEKESLKRELEELKDKRSVKRTKIIVNTINVYGNDSMLRFGDDLTEEVLQYMRFKDKIRLECVSKQWQRLIYNKQYVIEIYGSYDLKNDSLKKLYQKIRKHFYSINRIALLSVLKKCPNIKKVYLGEGVNNLVLSLIGRYCSHIKTLELSNIGRIDKILDFFRMYGHKLEDLELYKYSDENIEEFKQILKFCPNLKRIDFFKFKYCLDNDKEFLPKLENIDYFEITPQDLNELKIMSEKFSQTIKTLNIELSYVTTEELKTCIDCITRFENLKELKLIIASMEIEEPIDDCLSLIGQKCNKLSKFDFEISPTVPISDRFINIFSLFKAIKKLKINISHEIVLSGSVECFKHCKQLKHLDIICGKTREDFFANIASFVPKLQLLRIEIRKKLSDSFINYFLSMKKHSKC